MNAKIGKSQENQYITNIYPFNAAIEKSHESRHMEILCTSRSVVVVVVVVVVIVYRHKRKNSPPQVHYIYIKHVKVEEKTSFHVSKQWHQLRQPNQ